MDRYIVFKKTGTHADVLAAIGAADVLRHIEPRIVSFEDRFEVRLSRDLLPADLAAVDPGFPYLLLPGKTTPKLPPERVFEVQSTGATLADERMCTIVRRMKAYAGPNAVIARFAKMRHENWSTKVWECFQGGTRFSVSSPLVQLFNPQAAKGYALLKPAGTMRRDKTKDRWAEPFVEWLRYRGYFEGSAGWFTSGDLRLFCPIPANVSYQHFAGAVAAFRDLPLGGMSVKMDCRAVLGLTRHLIETAEEYREPADWVNGVWVTHYKDMGQAHTVMSMEQLAVPRWFELRGWDHAQRWRQTIDEHEKVLRRLDDRHAEEYALLNQYRRTFKTRWQEAIPEFLEFLAAYVRVLFQRRAQGHFSLPQLSVSAILPILQRDPELRAAIDNSGLLAVSSALWEGTLGAQAERNAQYAGHREVRYGLFGDLRRAGVLGRRELFAAITSFVASFNRETVRLGSRRRFSVFIKDSDMQALARLFEQLPAGIRIEPLLSASVCAARHAKVSTPSHSASAEEVTA